MNEHNSKKGKVKVLYNILDYPEDERRARLTAIGKTEAEYRAQLEASIAEMEMEIDKGEPVEQSDKFNDPIAFDILD